MTTKEFDNLKKRLWSALFARRMPYLIIDWKHKVQYFTDVPINSDNFVGTFHCHKVIVKNDEFWTCLTEHWDQTQSIDVLNVNAFTTLLNKLGTSEWRIRHDLVNGYSACALCGENIVEYVGNSINEYELKRVLDEFVVDSTKSTSYGGVEIPYPSDTKPQAWIYLLMTHPMVSEEEHYYSVFYPGITGVSYATYKVKESESPMLEMTITLRKIGTIYEMHAGYNYSDDVVSVQSRISKSRWTPVVRFDKEKQSEKMICHDNIIVVDVVKPFN